MGHGIAQAFAAGGCLVHCYDDAAAARASLQQRVRANLDQFVAENLVPREAVDAILARVIIAESEDAAVEGARFITEAVSEDLPLKQRLFARIEGLARPDAVIASNSSSFPMTQTAVHMRHPERAIVTHWFNPPHIVPVVEVVPGERTSPATTQAACAILKRIGKQPVRVNKELTGFLVNRVQVAMFREIWDLLDRGVASAEEIDLAIRGSMGMRLAALGPLRIIDFAGWDVTASVYKNLITDMRSDTELPDVIKKLVEERRFGAKAGQGVYEYTPESLQASQAERDRLYLALLKLLHDNA
jgi:3-hydroxyacyl-CoA dehydrogenase